MAALHVPTCALLLRMLHLGALGAALATSWSTLLNTAGLAACVVALRLQPRVWGAPGREALQVRRRLGVRNSAAAPASQPASEAARGRRLPWHSPTRRGAAVAPAQGWGSFARLAYPSAAMKCIESYSFSLCTVAAGLLPDPRNSISAIGVAFNVYGVLYMPFVAESIAVSTRRARLAAPSCASPLAGQEVAACLPAVPPQLSACLGRWSQS